MMKKKLLRIFCLSVFTLLCVGLSGENVMAQEKIITGKVTDSKDGGALPGVSVKLKGSTTVTSTDGNGKFSIKASQNSRVLIFTFVGYEVMEKFIDDEKSVMNVSLTSSSQGLDEVVVVAYGAQKKETVTGALSSISPKEIKQSPAANLAVTLAGRLPGLTVAQRSGEPGRDLTQLYIRGQGTTNTQSPIVLVDGVERDLTFIDPNEVESVTILKDASSTAIFGVRGANGVILVTTKRGTSEVPEINLTAETGGQDFTRIAQPVNAFQFATLRNLANANDGLPQVYSADALAAYQSGSDPLRYANTDWVKELVRKFSPQARYNLNIGGAAKNVRYFVNAGVLKQGGNFKTEDNLNYDPSFKLGRYNFRSNIDLQITKGLKAFLNIAGYLEKQNSPYGVALASTGQGGDSPSLYVLANIYDLPSNIPGPLTPSGAVSTNSTVINVPYGLLNRSGYRQQTRSNVTATYGMEQNLDFVTKGLSVKAVVSFDTKSINNLNAIKTFAKEVQFIDPNNLGADGKPLVTYRPFNADIDGPLGISGSGNFSSNSNFQGFLNYNRTFGKHTFGGLVLFQQQQNIIDSQLPFNLIGVSNRLTYGYDNRYFAEFNAGYNGSEQFAKGRRFGFFPAFSGAWVISNEKFWDVKAINSLKVRGSYGEVGNDRISTNRFLYLDDISTGGLAGTSASLGNNQLINIALQGNPSLQWEVARKADIGLEIGFLKSFNLVVDVFSENRDNVLQRRGTVPLLNGLPVSVLAPVNVGAVQNRGYEVELNYKKFFTNDFSIVSRINMSYATNKQTRVDEAQLSSDYAFRYRQQGYRIGQNFGYVVDRYFTSQQDIDNSPQQILGVPFNKPGDFKYQDMNGDGIIDPRDIAPIGYSAIPEYNFGAAVSITYKNFDLSVLFQGVTNVSNYYQGRGTVPGSNYYVNHLESWTAERAAAGDPINYPRLTTLTSPNQIANSFFILDASYVRLKNLEVGYTLPLRLSNKIGSKRVRFYTNGLNLFTWDKLPTKQFDPELTTDLSYPVLRVINFGVNVAF